jgi:hypothetical protein
MSRVIFYKESPGGLDLGPRRIGIKIDGRGIVTLSSGQYVQVDLEPGRHHLELSHTDTLTFTDEYTLRVEDGPIYVRVYRTELSTHFDSSQQMPAGFAQKFRPVKP